MPLVLNNPALLPTPTQPVAKPILTADFCTLSVAIEGRTSLAWSLAKLPLGFVTMVEDRTETLKPALRA